MMWTCDKCNRSYPDTGKTIRCICRAGGSSRFIENGRASGGPGTELTELLKSYGIEEKSGCSCRAVARQMDQWGVDGCRQQKNFDWIVERVKENAKKYSWFLRLPAMLTLPLVITIAIERAAKKSEGV
jgi:hypothetical protein